jgi:hypothetical protein
VLQRVAGAFANQLSLILSQHHVQFHRHPAGRTREVDVIVERQQQDGVYSVALSLA